MLTRSFQHIPIATSCAHAGRFERGWEEFSVTITDGDGSMVTLELVLYLIHGD